MSILRAQALLLEAVNNYDELSMRYPRSSLSARAKLRSVEELHEPTPPPPDVNALVLQAMQQRPEIQALQDQFLARKNSATRTRSQEADYLSAWRGGARSGARGSDHQPLWGSSVNINIPIFNGFYFDARAKNREIQTNQNRQRLTDERNNIARDVRNVWQDSRRAFSGWRNPATAPAGKTYRSTWHRRATTWDSAQSRAYPGELQKTQADIEDTDASINTLDRNCIGLYHLCTEVSCPLVQKGGSLPGEYGNDSSLQQHSVISYLRNSVTTLVVEAACGFVTPFPTMV